ncbi:MAG TPA: outer membrane beta-barrel protein [Polyangiaceae bacterium]
MRKLAAFTVLAAAVLASTAALAQEPDELPPPAAEPPAAEPPAPPAVTVSIPSCRLAEHAGFEEADARTAAMLVCASIAHAGPSPNARYRVSLGKLGSILILAVAQEGAVIGSTVDSREMRLQGIEEVDVAAPRIAASIVHGVPLVETERVDNLVGGDTRIPKSRPGTVHFALGIVGMAPPLDQGLSPAPGLMLDLHYETPNQRIELGGSFRGGGGSASSQSPSIGFAIFSVGGRYYTSDSDFSPYVGGGLSWGYLNLSLPGQNLSGDNSGLGAYVDAGVEILRTHHTHLAIGARLDVPFFALNTNPDAATYNSASGSYATATPTSYFYAPLSLELRLTF